MRRAFAGSVWRSLSLLLALPLFGVICWEVYDAVLARNLNMPVLFERDIELLFVNRTDTAIEILNVRIGDTNQAFSSVVQERDTPKAQLLLDVGQRRYKDRIEVSFRPIRSETVQTFSFESDVSEFGSCLFAIYFDATVTVSKCSRVSD